MLSREKTVSVFFFNDFWSFGAIRVTFHEGPRQKKVRLVSLLLTFVHQKHFVKAMAFGGFTPLAQSMFFHASHKYHGFMMI